MKSALIIVMVTLLSACTSTVSRTDLLTSMEEQISRKRSHINILWYRGTKEHYHYLSHVYEMFGSRDYRISDADLTIPEMEIIPLTSDSTKWKRISKIGIEWEASRKRDDSWLPDPEGLTLT